MLSALIRGFSAACAAPDQEIDLASFNSTIDQGLIARYHQEKHSATDNRPTSCTPAVPYTNGCSAPIRIGCLAPGSWRNPTALPPTIANDWQSQPREADGTLEWQQTLLLLVEVRGGGLSGLGYSYASYGSAYVTKELLPDIVENEERFFDSCRQCGLAGASSSPY